MSVLVSVIIPTYNRRQFLESISVPSVLNQTFQDFELIIVDDHSNDGTEKFVSHLMKKDSRIRYIKNFRTKGVSGARNSGVLVSRGKYISFLDSDDEWVPTHLETLLYYLEKYPDKIDVISAAQVLVDYQTKKQISCKNLDIYEKFPGYYLEEAYIFCGNLFDHALKMFLFNDCAMLSKRNVFDRVLYPEDLRICEDSFFVLNVAYFAFKVAFFPKIHLYYYIHNHNTISLSKSLDPSKALYNALGMIDFYKKCLSFFDLSPSQMTLLRKKLSDSYCWLLAYNSYLPIGDYERFLSTFWQGLKLDFFNLRKWKTFLKYCFLTKILGRCHAKV